MYIATILTSNTTDCCLINFFVPILCCYFAHDYRNRPFCSPAFFFEFYYLFSNYFVRHITARNIL